MSLLDRMNSIKKEEVNVPQEKSEKADMSLLIIDNKNSSPKQNIPAHRVKEQELKGRLQKKNNG